MKPKISNLMEGPNSSLRKTYEEAVGCCAGCKQCPDYPNDPRHNIHGYCRNNKTCLCHQSTTPKSTQNEEKVGIYQVEGDIKPVSTTLTTAEKDDQESEGWEESLIKLFQNPLPNGDMWLVIREFISRLLLTQRERMVEEIGKLKKKPNNDAEEHERGIPRGYNSALDTAIEIISKSK